MRLIGYLRARPGFSLVVLLPSVLVAIYYAIFAADIYESEAQYVVKNTTQSTATSGLSSMLQGSGFGGSSDSYTVAAYLLSRDALHSLEQSADIRSIYARPEARFDFVAKFPNLLYRPSFENLFIHYGYWTEVDYDLQSGVSTLSVFAFRPDDAQLVATKLLDLSESLVNALNERARNDSLAAARLEVEHLQHEGGDIQKQITDFRFRELMIDPTASSTAALARLASMEADLVSTRGLLTQIQKASPQSPQIASLRQRIESLQQQVSAEEQRDSGGTQSLAPKMAEYEQLLNKQQFVQLMLQTSVSALETAEVTVQQQQLYIERVAAPNIPDRALYPYKLLDTLIAVITFLLIYAIGRLMVSVAKEHVSN